MGIGRQNKACQGAVLYCILRAGGRNLRLEDRGAGAPKTANEEFALTSFGEGPAPTEKSC